MSTYPIAVWAQDLHLQANAWARYPEIRGDAYVAVASLVSAAIDYKVPLILGGDIHDTKRPGQDAVRFFCNMAQRLSAHGLLLYYVLGDHDAWEYPEAADETAQFVPRPWTQLSIAVSINRRAFRLGPFNCYGLDYRPADLLPAELAQIPSETQILFTHQKWAEAYPFGAEARLADLQHVRFVFSGDLHKYQEVHAICRTGPLEEFSAGSICLQSIDEEPQKSAMLISVDDSAPPGLRVDRIVLPSRSVLRVKLADEAELARFPEQLGAFMASRPTNLPRLIEKPIVAVEYDPDIPSVYARLTAMISPVAHFFDIPRRRPHEVVDVAAAPPTRGDLAPLAAAVRQCAADNDRLATRALRLLRSVDRGAELDRMKHEFLEEEDGPQTTASDQLLPTPG